MDEFQFDNYFEPMKIGDTVPEAITFQVFHEEEIKTMSFGDVRGKWTVLLFYPGDFTYVCPTELEEMQKLYGEFQKEGAEVISVSTDSVEVHKAWHDTSPAIKTITYPMASDQTQRLSELFDVLIAEEGVALRGTFIIDPEGVVKSIEINDNAIGRKAKETLRKLQAAKYVSEHPGNVCPASWEEGDATLKKGLDLVGKI